MAQLKNDDWQASWSRPGMNSAFDPLPAAFWTWPLAAPDPVGTEFRGRAGLLEHFTLYTEQWLTHPAQLQATDGRNSVFWVPENIHWLQLRDSLVQRKDMNLEGQNVHSGYRRLLREDSLHRDPLGFLLLYVALFWRSSRIMNVELFPRTCLAFYLDVE